MATAGPGPAGYSSSPLSTAIEAEPDADADLAQHAIRIDSVKRLDYVRGHLARVQRRGLTVAERREMLRLLYLIQDDVVSLIAALKSSSD